MNRLRHLALLPLLACVVAFTGCDSEEDDRSAEERILGTWTATNVSVRVASPLGAVPVPILEAGDEGAISISFEASNAFVFTVEGPLEATVIGAGTFPLLADGEGTTNRGTYGFVEDDEQIRFTVTETDGQSVPETSFNVAFDFSGSDAFTFSLDASDEGREALAFLLGDAFPEEVFELIEGGQARFERVERSAN